LAACGDGVEPPAAGSPAPAVELRTLEGAPIPFPGSHRGTVTAVRFWADWCPYCEEEMRAIEPVYRELAGQGLRVLAVNVGQDAGTARRFIRGLGISYEVALDEDADAANRYGVLALPTTYFVDRDGIVRRRILGEAPVDAFREAAESLLAADG
jgi:thiol-disulfide isomerase/thioredoxin